MELNDTSASMCMCVNMSNGCLTLYIKANNTNQTKKKKCVNLSGSYLGQILNALSLGTQIFHIFQTDPDGNIA